MYILRLEDKKSSYDVFLFEDQVKKNPLPSVETTILIWGKISSFGEQSRFNTEGIVSLAHVREKKVKRSILNLKASKVLGNVNQFTNSFSDFLKENAGQVPCALKIDYDSYTLSFKKEGIKICLTDKFILDLKDKFNSILYLEMFN